PSPAAASRRAGDPSRGPPAGPGGAPGDRLFRDHPQSPIPPLERPSFSGLRWFPADAAYRVPARLLPADGGLVEIDTGGDDGVIRYHRIGALHFRLHGEDCSLVVLALIGYGGGLFVPLRDATSGTETYGGGRHLVDTDKNTDAGCFDITVGAADVVIDFNYAYHPSCQYNPPWACPLATVG